MSKKHDIHDQYGGKVGELREQGKLSGEGYGIHDEYGGKVGELRKQRKLFGDGYAIHGRYGGKVGELVPIPSIPSSVYVVIGIVLLVGFVLSFLLKTITGITDSIGRSVPWVILYSVFAGYLWVWWYRSSHEKPMPLLRTTVAFIGLVFIGSSQQLFPKLRPYLEHIPNILFILEPIRKVELRDGTVSASFIHKRLEKRRYISTWDIQPMLQIWNGTSSLHT